ncbi:MAG: hypothetical protein HYY06_20665 [Deltaproteobacteria bacterium]|nr:hypothetical protein [Deltaproteobacteria bacterium]
MRWPLAGLFLVVIGCEPAGSPSRSVQAEREEPDAAGPPAPDGIPVSLGAFDELVASLAVDADDDGDRDLFAVLRSVASPYRLELFTRDGDRYSAPRRIEAGILDELAEGAVEKESLALEGRPEGLVRLTLRYEETCAPAEHEEVAVDTFFPVERPERPALSYFSRYRRLPCGRADSNYLATCRPEPFVDRRIAGRLEEDGGVFLLEASRRVGAETRAAGMFTFRRTAARFVQDPGRTVDLVAQVRRDAQAAASRPAEEALEAAELALEVLDTACPAAGVEMTCHGTSLGIPDELRAPCAAARDRGAIILLQARALARLGRARAALVRLGQARESGADAALFGRAERDILALVAPAAARPVGIMAEAALASGDAGALPPPFTWESPESVLYTLPDGDVGRLILGQGDQGKVKGLDARDARRLRAGEHRSPSGGRSIVAADAFGIFVCPADGREHRTCLEAARASRRDVEDLSCRLVGDRLPDTPTTRLTLGPCAGDTDPTALGFTDDDHVAIVAADAADPVVVSLSDPTKREPLAAGPSAIYAGSSFAADGSFRLIRSDLGLFRVERGPDGSERRILPPGFDPTGISISPDGRHFAALVARGGARVFELPR